MDSIQIQSITTIEQLKEMQVVEEAVWQMPPTPIHQTYTAVNHGGIALGAYDGDNMIGFLYSFAGFNGKETYLCSHMLGILPEYRKTGLGTKMKFQQAELAKELGYSYITWTFDPLESLNAYLNIHKLGAVGAYYKENHYGEMNDGLNTGLPTDRIQIIWDMNKNVGEKKKITVDPSKVVLDNISNKPLLKEDLETFLTNDGSVFVAIPNNIQQLKREQIEIAKQWRFNIRKVLQRLFEEGYLAANVATVPSKGSFYYFTKNQN